MASIDIASLLSGAGAGALLGKGLDWILERKRKSETETEARSTARIADDAAIRSELWARFDSQQKENKEMRDDLDRARAMNAEITSRLLSMQIEIDGLRKSNEELQKEVEALQRVIGRAATDTGKHNVVS